LTNTIKYKTVVSTTIYSLYFYTVRSHWRACYAAQMAK